MILGLYNIVQYFPIKNVNLVLNYKKLWLNIIIVSIMNIRKI